MSRKRFWLVFFVTFCVGFLPMLVFSYFENSIFSDKLHLPMIKYFSIIVGDAFILPIFNGFLIEYISSGKSKTKIISKKAILVSILLSFVVNYLTHFMIWSKDETLSFMDLNYSELSLAGWWHFLFSFVQMMIIFCFLGVCWRNNDYSDRFLLYAKISFLFFTLLQIPDFLIRNFSNIISNGIASVPLVEFSSMITILVSLTTFVKVKKHDSRD
jgi:hypothetical protein